MIIYDNHHYHLIFNLSYVKVKDLGVTFHKLRARSAPEAAVVVRSGKMARYLDSS